MVEVIDQNGFQSTVLPRYADALGLIVVSFVVESWGRGGVLWGRCGSLEGGGGVVGRSGF